LFNEKFQAIWQDVSINVCTGMSITEITDLAQESGLVHEVYHERSGESRVFLLNNGNWFQMSERATTEGGLVITYTDITAVKERETLIREAALAEKTALLQRTVDNLSQGVVLVNSEGTLELWNNRFLELTGLPLAPVEGCPPFAALALNDKVLQHGLTCEQQEEVIAAKQWIKDGKVIEVKTHPLPDGGFVNTYTDITERHKYAETLRASEQWVRLITDNVPAMICYVGKDHRYQFTNKVYDEWYGYERGELNGELITRVHSRDEMTTLIPYFEKALGGDNVAFEMQEQDRHGDGEKSLLKYYVPNKDADGKVVGCFVMNRDITERRRTALELREAYRTMEQRVIERTSELTELNDQLRDASHVAEQANLSKTKFLAAVSHDLLQPLNAARLFTSALSEQVHEPDQHSMVAAVSNSLDDVESLLGTLVDISKLDAGAVSPDVTSFDLESLLNNIANEYQQIAQSENLGFRFVPCSLVVNSDSQLLARILRNFLSNAMRYTHDGRILLGCRRKPEGVEIQVWDTGVGIPKALREEIFEEFKRLDPSNKNQDKGLGLGLAIVDKISRVLGHEIKVTSEQGKGSMFSVTVPLGTVVANESQRHGPYFPESLAQLTGRSIWVIDNEQAICDGMEKLLSNWGCDVVTALSFADLATKVDFKTAEVDLLIADYHLDDGQNGVDAASQVCKALARELPVLMITANYDKDLKQSIRA
ncbi:MAG: NahK/ErcS family hybrid sensor histidine kinase/response regulator, partial [Pontibacterium sp.]